MNAELAALKLQVEKGMKAYQAFKDAGDALAALVNIDQVVAELTAHKAALEADVARVAAALNEAEASLTAVREKADAEIARGRAEAREIVARANDEAKARLFEAHAEVEAWGAKVADLANAASAAKAERDVAQQELQQLSEKISAAKQAAARLLGA